VKVPQGPKVYDTEFDAPSDVRVTERTIINSGSDDGLPVLGRALLRSWPGILGLTLLGAIAGLLVANSLPRRYFAEAIILIQPQRNPLDPTGPVPAASAEVVRTQLEVIRSRQVIDRVVRKLKLASDPKFAADLPNTGNRMDAIGERVAERLKVENDGRSFALKIGFEAESPTKASRIADAFAAEYLAEQREQKQRTSDASVTGLQDRLDQLRQEVFAAEQAAEAFRRNNGLISLAGVADGSGEDGGSLSPTSRELSEVARQKAQVSTQRAQAVARAREAANDPRGGRGTPEVLSSSSVSGLVAQEADLARREAELAERYNPGHPLLDQIQEQRTSVRSAINREIGNVQASVRSQAQAARAAETQTEANAARLRSELDRELSATVRYRQLLREADVRRSVYEEFAQQVGRLAQRATVQVPDAVLAAGAPIPLQPVSPKPLLLIALGAIGGAALGTALGLLLAWRRRTTIMERQRKVGA
jgi:uncharacterized protein involved in exopolysaccharide biosynthesis